jgi:hypothetical protein
MVVDYVPKDSGATDSLAITKQALCKTWVLTQKDSNGQKETFPNNDTYPITLTFDTTDNFRGRHDANIYEGIYAMKQNAILLSYNAITDVSDINWYLDYLQELPTASTIHFIGSDTMHLSNQDSSFTLYFISKTLFEKSYFEFEEWYNF